jgi:hypothetical protein
VRWPEGRGRETLWTEGGRGAVCDSAEDDGAGAGEALHGGRGCDPWPAALHAPRGEHQAPGAWQPAPPPPSCHRIREDSKKKLFVARTTIRHDGENLAGKAMSNPAIIPGARRAHNVRRTTSWRRATQVPPPLTRQTAPMELGQVSALPS